MVLGSVINLHCVVWKEPTLGSVSSQLIAERAIAHVVVGVVSAQLVAVGADPGFAFAARQRETSVDAKVDKRLALGALVHEQVLNLLFALAVSFLATARHVSPMRAHCSIFLNAARKAVTSVTLVVALILQSTVASANGAADSNTTHDSRSG